MRHGTPLAFFWLNASGLGHLFPSLERWGENIRAALDKIGFYTSVAIGFSRFGTYAVARALRGLCVFESTRDEDRAAQRVPLSRLDIPPDAQESFIKLHIRTVADFMRLPPKGLLKRFGPEVEALQRLAAGDLFAPLTPEPPKEPLTKTMELTGPVADSERLLFFVKQLLDTLLQDLEAKSLALTKLFLRLELDDHRSLEEVLRPDAPTLASPLLLGLVRLRLETLRLDAGAVELCLRAKAVLKTVEQLLLAREKPKREPRKQSRAFARLRAEFGHPLAPLREALRAQKLPDARTVAQMKNGRRARYAGLVICRQRPGTASGVTFMTLEDESGFVNLVLWPKKFEEYAVLAKTTPFLGVTGKVQSEQSVVHFIVDKLWKPKLTLEPKRIRSRDFSLNLLPATCCLSLFEGADIERSVFDRDAGHLRTRRHSEREVASISLLRARVAKRLRRLVLVSGVIEKQRFGNVPALERGKHFHADLDRRELIVLYRSNNASDDIFPWGDNLEGSPSWTAKHFSQSAPVCYMWPCHRHPPATRHRRARRRTRDERYTS